MNLITGATGLVGAHVALQLLQEGKSVIAIKRNTSDILKTKNLFKYYVPDFENLFNKIKWVDADICDIYSLLDVLDGIETVYHCAGFVSFDSKDKKRMDQINTIGTANVVNASLEKNIKALCYVSSIATLKNPDITKNISESVYWKSSPSASDYSISKYNGEREVWRGMEEGLQAVIVNPGVIFGPGFWQQSSGKLINTCYKGSPFYTIGSTATVDVKDVAGCMIQLVEKKQFNKRFVVIENNYSFKEILAQVHKALGKNEPKIKAGKWLLVIAKYLDAFRCALTNSDRIITKETITAGLEKNTFDNSKIKQALNYQFIPFTDTVKFVGQAYLNDIKK
jgi:nucleoside-diphosphate-sugar epimerase